MGDKIHILVLMVKQPSEKYPLFDALENQREYFDYDILFASKACLIIKDGEEKLFYHGKEINPRNYDALLCLYYGKGLKNFIKFFEEKGVFCLQAYETITLCDDKYRCLSNVNKYEILYPKTLYFDDRHIFSPEEIQTMAKENIGSYPYILKPNNESLGRGVKKINNFYELVSGIKNIKSKFLIEEMISPNNRTDERYNVLNGKIINAMKRIAKDGNIITNLAAGGRAQKIVPDKETADLCGKIMEALNIEYAGIDIIRDENGTPYFLEANSLPMPIICEITGYNHYNDILDFVKEKISK